MKELTGRNALITGGGRGLGAATALALAQAGAAVALVARNEDQVVEVAAQLRDEGYPAFAFRCDVTRPFDVRDATMAAREAMGRVDILVNNAETAGAGPLTRVHLDEWNHVMAVNVTGAFLFTKALLPDMVANGWGRVINVASLAGLRGARHLSAYSASKHALVGFTQAVAAEVEGTGVTVNALCPGYVDSPFTHQALSAITAQTGEAHDGALETMLERAGQHRLIPPVEVAEAVVALCCTSADLTHGEAIPMDGGGWNRDL